MEAELMEFASRFFIGGWLIPALSLGAGLLQGLSSSRADKKNRQLTDRQLAEQKRQFDLSHGLDRQVAGQRHALDERQVGLAEGIDRRKSSGLAATSGVRQQLIAQLLRRLGSGVTGGSL